MYYTTRSVSNHKVDFTHVQKFFGYIAYWKLVGQLLKMCASEEAKIALNQLNVFQRIWFYVQFPFKVLYYVTLKPLGMFYSYKTKMTGTYEIVDGYFTKEKFKMKKNKTHYLFKIPVLTHPSSFTDKDLEKLMNQ